MSSDYLDISVPISAGMLVWSTHERVSMETAESSYAGSTTRVTSIRLTSHTGTHVDAPFHFGDGRTTVDQLGLDTLIGPARVFDFRGSASITAEMLSSAGVGSTPRVLLKTDNSRWVRTGPMPDVPAHLTEDAARYLIDAGVGLVGIDGLTVDGPETTAAHSAFLSAGVIIVETLDLSEVEAGEYELVCLPLRIAGADGAPARAVLRALAA